MTTRLANLSWKRSLGELSLIVIGVLIALAGNSWWEYRKDRKDENAYLRQLLSDVQETENTLKAAISSDSANLARISRIVDIAFNGPVPRADSFAINIGYTQFRPRTGTYTALLQSGGLQLLTTDSVRFQVIAYAAILASTQELLRHTEALSWINQERALLALAKHSQSSTGDWRALDVGRVLRDPEFVSAVQLQRSAIDNRVRNLRRLEQPTATLKALLEDELRLRSARSPSPG
ncbi:MAG: DUF6090 family protein [Gemmatimonadota bacterium]